MAEQQDSLTDEQLDERVDALVNEMNEVSAQISRAIADESDEPDTDDIIASGGPIGDGGVQGGPVEADAAADEDADEVAQQDKAPDDEAAGDEPAAEDAAEIAAEDETGDVTTDEPTSDAEPEPADDAEPEPAVEVSDDDEPPADENDESALIGEMPPEAGDGEDAGSLDDQVESMLDEAISEPADAPEPAAEQPRVEDARESSAAASVDDLDAELAELADGLLEGDFDDVDAVLEGGNPPDFDAVDAPAPAPEADGASAAAVGSESDQDAEPAGGTEADTGERSEPAAAEPATAHAGADSSGETVSAGASSAEPVAAEPGARRAEEPERTEAASAAAPSVRLRERVTQAVYDAALAANKPLDPRPSYARDVVGWFAAVTLFNAVAVWAFWMLMAKEPPGRAPADAVTIELPAAVEPAPGEATDPG